jgi:hypothetical protein
MTEAIEILKNVKINVDSILQSFHVGDNIRLPLLNDIDKAIGLIQPTDIKPVPIPPIKKKKTEGYPEPPQP